MGNLEHSQQGVVAINGFENKVIEKLEFNKLTTFVPNRNRPIHNWFAYLQGYSASLVNELIEINKISNSSTVLDPFCGVGTTLLECKRRGINSRGFDISPLAVFVSKAKLHTDYDVDGILSYSNELAWIKPWHHDLPSHPIFGKGITQDTIDVILSLKDRILEVQEGSTRDFLLLALMSIIEETSLIRKDGAHYRYIDKPQSDNPLRSFQHKVTLMIADVIQEKWWTKNKAKSEVSIGDARDIKLKDQSVDFVITSPPYLNRDNYIAQHKLELFLMDFVVDNNGYRELTHNTLRSHVEAKYSVTRSFQMEEVDLLVEEISRRPLNNNQIPKMIHGYFEDMDIVLAELSRCVRKNGTICIVVGNSAWAGVLVEVDKILAKTAMRHGFEVNAILVTRYKLNSAQQISKYGRILIRESIITAIKRQDT